MFCCFLSVLFSKLFLFCFLQVSLVWYFAIPPDLSTRYPGPTTEKFLALFSRYIDLPLSEEGRLKLWGFRRKSSANAEDKELRSVAETDYEFDPYSSANVTAPTSPASSGWGLKMPSEITWPNAFHRGAFPSTDFRNCRFELIPTLT